MTKVKVAAAHVSPVFLDTPATIDKACALVKEAAHNGAQLVAFPETYVSAFPVWLALRAPIHNHDMFKRFAMSAILACGPEVARVAKAAKQAGIFVSLGFNESVKSSVGTIFNSNVLISDDGSVLNHHRKLVPTFYEKLVWAPGDGGGLRVCETRIGNIGMLICGENTNPLARYTMIAQGEQIHIATWPPIWPTHKPDANAAYDLAHGIRLRGGAHAFEGKLFNIVVSACFDKATRDELAALDSAAADILESAPRGVSAVFGPSGAPVTEIAQDNEQILYADIDLDDCIAPRQLHDVAGGYNRFDVFDLKVNRRAHRPIRFELDQPDSDPDAPA